MDKKFEPIFEEIENHLNVLNYVGKKIEELPDFPDSIDFNDYEILLLLDAFVFRFIKAQSAIGEKLFPLLFEYLTGRAIEEVSFIDILNTLEKYGILDSAEQWKEIRKLRNEFVHTYPWELEERKEALLRGLEERKFLEKIFRRIAEKVKDKNG